MKKSFFYITILPLFLFFFACKGGKKDVESTTETKTQQNVEIEVLEPVKWTYETKKLADNLYKIIFTATIDEGWYVYSSTIEGDGPIPTTINFDDLESLGEVSEIDEFGEETKEGHDEMFDMNVKKFAKGATFSQTIKTNGPGTVTGYLEYETCDHEKCLFPDPVEFSFEVE